MVDFGKPFATARDTRVHAVFLRAPSDECAIESMREETLMPMASASAESLRATVARGWNLYRTQPEADACRAMERASLLATRFDVIYGLRTGDNARHVRPGPGALPLIAGRDFDAYDRAPAPRHLHDAAPFLSALRKQQGRWKIGIQRIRTNSSVPWRRWVEAVLLEPGEVGLDSLTLIADRDATGDAPSDALLSLLGVLNSSLLNRWYRLTFTDVNVKPIYVESLPVPPVDPRLVDLVRRRLARPGDAALERAIDRVVATAYGLSDRQVSALESGFWGATRPPLPPLDEALAVA